MTFFLTKNLDFSKNSSLTPSCSQFVLYLTSNNRTSQNIGEDGCMDRPRLEFGGYRPPFPPKSPPVSHRPVQRALLSKYLEGALYSYWIRDLHSLA